MSKVHDRDPAKLKYIFPHTNTGSDRGISSYEMFVSDVTPDFPTIREWTGKKHPTQHEIAVAVAQIKCYVADAIFVEMERQA